MKAFLESFVILLLVLSVFFKYNISERRLRSFDFIVLLSAVFFYSAHSETAPSKTQRCLRQRSVLLGAVSECAE